MPYLDPSEYAQYGIDEETPDAIVQSASAMIDAYCRRSSLAVQAYTEQLQFARDSQTLRVSALPLQSVTTLRARARCNNVPVLDQLQQDFVTLNLNNTWTDIDPSTLDVRSTGEVTTPQHILGAHFSEAEITYTAGFAEIPVAVKTACAQIVRNAQSTPALNVKRSSVSAMQLEYFSSSLLDNDTKRLLAPYIATRLGA